MPLISINPATNEKIREFSETTVKEARVILRQAQTAFEEWRSTDYAHRAGLLSTVSDELRTNTNHYAEIMTEEMGKPIKEARSEAEKSAWVCDYYAENGEAFMLTTTCAPASATSDIGPSGYQISSQILMPTSTPEMSQISDESPA